MENNGLKSIKSDFSADETMERIEKLLKWKDFHIFVRIDHGRSAEEHDRKLNPTQLIVFGNPKTGGTGLMQENQTIGIDLPAKILVWEDSSHQTYITYNDIKWLVDRHNLSDKNKEVIDQLKTAIKEVCFQASKQ